MAEVLAVETRDTRGKRRTRRQRIAGRTPAVLYGHGEKVISLSVDAGAISAAIRRGSRLVELSGACQESAFIREVQWDTFGNEVLHVDFTRISADERVSVTLPVELKGIAPGLKEGGVVQHLQHIVEIECPAGLIPDKLVVSINHLKLGDSVTAGMIELPPGAQLLSPAEAIVVQCVLPVVIDETEAAPAAAEPELIGRKAEEEDEEE